MNLLVIYTPQLEACRDFYASLGLVFVVEQHGLGPEHYAATLADGTVFELYPARVDRRTDTLRLGLVVQGGSVSPPLYSGLHLITDPDGRTVEVHAR
ncbi:MAG TPA: hypothetical protein VGX23_26415 [Actinocrinis sp.]|nr:hypothetical protein [Actinocrinis sp.]